MNLQPCKEMRSSNDFSSTERKRYRKIILKRLQTFHQLRGYMGWYITIPRSSDIPLQLPLLGLLRLLFCLQIKLDEGRGIAVNISCDLDTHYYIGSHNCADMTACAFTHKLYIYMYIRCLWDEPVASLSQDLILHTKPTPQLNV